MKALSIPTAAELESLVTTAIYSSLISARLSPASNPPLVHVTSVAPLRDVRPQTVSDMISILSEWEGRCGAVIGGIEAEVAKIKARAAKNREREHERASRRERSIAGWNGDGAEDSTGADRGPGKSHRKPPAGRKLGGAGGGSSSNKREFRGDDIDEDDGYFDNGSDGGVDTSGGRMDIDQGAGAGTGGSGRTGSSTTRQAKRVLGVGRKT
jgi:COP9 signalosome complex subunit 7